MNYYPPTVRHLIRSFSRLPGIGEKTAERLAMYIIRASKKEVEALAGNLMETKEKVGLCRQCFALSDNESCEICRNPARNEGLICVVEQPVDMVAIEKAGAFSGRYHILQGALSPMDGIGPGDIRIHELISKARTGVVKEIIVATSTTVEGEATASYISQQLEGLPIRVTRIATGVPVGGDLQYVDPVTLQKALESRRAV